MCGDSSNTQLILKYARHTNDVVREYAIAALGRCGTLSFSDTLKSLLKKEKNGYVVATIHAAIKKIVDKRPPPFVHFPLYDTTGLKKTSFLFNPGLDSKAVFYRDTSLDAVIVQAKAGAKMIFPHQQYKVNPTTIYNRLTYGLAIDGPTYHVGEDSGYFMEGMSIHAIADGIVTNMLYDLSWGYFVAIQSNLPVTGMVTAFYGHLSHDIDVRIGESVEVGDKIGEMGPQETLENGGYKTHLHLGVAKGSYKTAKFHGYAPTFDNWFNPVALIGKENNPKGPKFRKVLFGD
jgi:murein DD-endopeptidase MepM/ murein hydrolase activator NlpD